MHDSGILINQRYRLEEEIGRGGIGVVYRARDTLLERQVAVKFLHTSGLGTQGRARLLREAQIVAGLNHANIVTVHDAGEVPEGPYLVMELVEGTPLDRLIPLPLEKIPAFLSQICSALEYAHQRGIVHRDLKPGNILLEKNGLYRLMDFGLARSAATRATLEGAITGTVFYMAPEQALGKEVDARSDLYSLGIILYELATGEVPFSGDDPLAVITQHLYAPAVPPRLKNEAIPAALDDLILRLLSKEPADRPASAAEALQILESGSLAEAAQPAGAASILERIVRGRMVAREPELAEAEKLWDRVKSGESQVLLISGEPGVGKTRFLQEIVARVGVKGGTALTGECFAEGGTPYAPFAQIARAFFQAAPPGESFPEYILADLLLLAPDLRPRYPQVQPPASQPPSSQTPSPLDPKAEQARLFENMVAWCQLLCEQKPLLIALEDAHWADSGSLGLFHHLVRRTRKLPVLFALTYREVELDEQLPLQGLLVELNRERVGTSLKLKRLDERGTEAMLATLFAEEITPDFLAGIYRATEGNPFFTEEVCKALVESGEVFYQDGRWQRPSMEAIRIPQSVRLAIQTRLGKLPEEVQETLRLAALIGREFEVAVLQAASGLAEERLIEAVESSEDSQFIQELSASDGLTYQFTHALFPATLAEGIHTLRRRRMHRQVGEAFQRVHPDGYEALAYHFTEGGDDRQAYTYHVKAGRKAAAAFANEEAEEHFLAALNLVEAGGEKAGLLLELAGARQLRGHFLPAKADYLAAAEIFLAQDDLEQGAIALRNAARAVWDAGDTTASLELALQGLERVAGLQDGRGLAALLSETGRDYFFTGQAQAGIPYVRRAMEIAERAGYPEVLCDSLITMGLLIPWGRESIEFMERAALIAEKHGLYAQLQRALNNLCLEYSMVTGEYAKARASARRGMQAARQRNDLAQEMFVGCNYLELMIEQGEYAEAGKLLARLHQVQDALPPEARSQRSLMEMEGIFLHRTGQVEQALEIHENVRQAALEAQDLQVIIGNDFHLAWMYLQTQAYGKLKQVLEEALELSPRLPPIFVPALQSMQVILLCREGQVEQAAQLLQALTNREKPSLSPDLYDAPVALATAELALSRREWERAWEAYAGALAAFRAVEMPFWQAQVLRAWAAGLQRRGEPDDLVQARQLLEQASQIMGRG